MEKTPYSPMMMQYLKVKEQYPDTLLFYRIGDFYEMFFEDAKTASRELDLVLTGKNAGAAERVPMCGVPHHAVTSYVQRLVQRGYKIAIVEQLQDPSEAKGIVERDVIRVITPGTVMEEITDEKESVSLCAIEDFRYGYTLSMAEVSTGESVLCDTAHSIPVLAQNLLRNNVREVVVSSSFDSAVIKRLREMNIVISYCEETAVKPEYSPLCTNLKKDYQLLAFGRMLNYLEATQKHTLGHLSTVRIESESEVLYMDFSIIRNLELIEPLHKENKGESLWNFLDVCKSAMGSRLLKKWIEKPLVKQKEIEARYDRLETLRNDFLGRKNLREHLGGIYDLQRLIGRCAMNSANPQDLLRLSKTLNEVPSILSCLDETAFGEYRSLDPLDDLRVKLDGAFNDNPPSSLSDGGAFKDGYSAELDAAREIQRNGRQFISSLEAAERERTGIKTLRIGYNKVFGYYIEISKAAAAQVKEEWGYVRRQTHVNNERFISPELKEKEEQILHAEENAIRIEKQLFAGLLGAIRERLAKLQRLSLALAELDCYAALAEVSSSYGYVRPEFTDDEFVIEQGKHPILSERMKKTRYIANHLRMDKNESILLITGPNMGGKSTYMRQTALIVILAQIGCYVPAKSVKMPVFDRIFTRIGASDDILSGQSTFMVEMSEANQALQNATASSLILFDEIGRGTSTYDGMALAQAMIEYIAACVHAKTLFSTHYHELTSLTDSIGCVRNVHVAVKEEDERVIFLYKVKDGRADRSYGVNVARLAGLPEAVIDRAKGLQKELESRKRVVQQSYQLVEMEKEDPVAKSILEKLRSVSADDLSPREAWGMLSDLSEEARGNKQEES